MTRSRLVPSPLAAAVIALTLTACTGSGVAPPSAQESIASPTIRPDDLVGRWGYAAYYNEADRPRIEAAARGQCGGRPIEIGRGPTGGVIMPVANQAQSQEVMIKGGPGGKNYIGPAGQTIGAQDNEIVSFDGKVLIVRTATSDQVGRMSSVYVRCGPRA
jgi:hypothetical protein